VLSQKPDLDQCSITVRVADYYVHPDYTDVASGSDVAILVLEEPLNLPVVNMWTGDALEVGTKYAVAGWGTTSYGGDMANILYETTVPSIDHDACVDLYSGVLNVPDNTICAAYEEGGIDTCQGDSGGPMFLRQEDGSFSQFGIVSYGYGCANAAYPGVYTEVSAYQDWIESIIYT